MQDVVMVVMMVVVMVMVVMVISACGRPGWWHIIVPQASSAVSSIKPYALMTILHTIINTP